MCVCGSTGMGCFGPARSPPCQYLLSILRFEERQLVSIFMDVVKNMKSSQSSQTLWQCKWAHGLTEQPWTARLNQILGFIESGEQSLLIWQIESIEVGYRIRRQTLINLKIKANSTKYLTSLLMVNISVLLWTKYAWCRTARLWWSRLLHTGFHLYANKPAELLWGILSEIKQARMVCFGREKRSYRNISFFWKK